MNSPKHPSLGELHAQLANALRALRANDDLIKSLHGSNGPPPGDPALTAWMDGLVGTQLPSAAATDSDPRAHSSQQHHRAESSAEPSIDHSSSHATFSRASRNLRQIGTAQLLAALDSAIEIQRKISQLAGQIPHAIFTSWFVNFDPVKAKVDATARWRAMQPQGESASPVCYLGELDPQYDLPNLQTYCDTAAMAAIAAKTRFQVAQLQQSDPEQHTRLQTIAAHFPSTLRASELGEIPDGWRVGNLSEILELTGCRDCKDTAEPLNDTALIHHSRFSAKPPYPPSFGHFITHEETFQPLLDGLKAPMALAEIPWLIYPPDIVNAFDEWAGHYLGITTLFSRRAATFEQFRQAVLAQQPEPPR